MSASSKQIQNIGSILRTLRLQRRITGEELGKRVGLSQSTISKIETGYHSAFKLDEIKKILNILNAPQTIRQQVFTAMNASQQAAHYHYDVQQSPEAPLLRERQTTDLRAFLLSGVHVMLQTLPYREALLRSRGVDEAEIDKDIKQTIKRQDLLWEKHRTFHFILHESVLYTTPADTYTQIVQLDRLERFIGRKRIKLGVLAYNAGLLTIENGSFILYDDQHVVTIIGTRDIEPSDPLVLTEHIKIFAELNKKTCYNDDARVLIRKAMDYFD
jgi:transcriptional regulator with XRE-family HTH domain